MINESIYNPEDRKRPILSDFIIYKNCTISWKTTISYTIGIELRMLEEKKKIYVVPVPVPVL